MRQISLLEIFRDRTPNIICTSIDYEFLKRLRTRLTWADIAYGFERQCIGADVVIDYAMERITDTEETNDDELAIASATANDSIIDELRRLGDSATQDDEAAPYLRWPIILLAWAYQQRDQLHDLLATVEEIYTEFDYPKELAPFVRYMPSDVPQLGSVEANEQRMIESIGEYVEQVVLSE